MHAFPLSQPKGLEAAGPGGRGEEEVEAPGRAPAPPRPLPSALCLGRGLWTLPCCEKSTGMGHCLATGPASLLASPKVLQFLVCRCPRLCPTPGSWHLPFPVSGKFFLHQPRPTASPTSGRAGTRPRPPVRAYLSKSLIIILGTLRVPVYLSSFSRAETSPLLSAAAGPSRHLRGLGAEPGLDCVRHAL